MRDIPIFVLIDNSLCDIPLFNIFPIFGNLLAGGGHKGEKSILNFEEIVFELSLF